MPATYTYDPANDLGKVRMYIDDRDLTRTADTVPYAQRSAIFSDEEINAFLTAAGGNVHYAAALALTTIAGNRQLLVMSRRIGRTTIDFGNVRRDLLAQARELLKISQDLNGGVFAPADGVAEIAYNSFVLRDMLHRRSLILPPLPPSAGG